MGILGKIVEEMGLPPMVATIDETIQGKHVSIRTSSRYTIVTVDGLELFFIRENGKYDGWGGMATKAACAHSSG
jgi:hypothetical protein